MEQPANKNITVIKHAKEEMTMDDFKEKYPQMIKEEKVKEDDEKLVANLPLGSQLYKAGVGKLPDSRKEDEKRQAKGN